MDLAQSPLADSQGGVVVVGVGGWQIVDEYVSCNRTPLLPGFELMVGFHVSGQLLQCATTNGSENSNDLKLTSLHNAAKIDFGVGQKDWTMDSLDLWQKEQHLTNELPLLGIVSAKKMTDDIDADS